MKIRGAILGSAVAVFFPVCSWLWSCSYSPPLWIPSKTADPLYRFFKGNRVGFIDVKGKIVIPPTLDADFQAAEFHDGLLRVEDGYVNTSGRKVLKDGLYSGGDFSEGLAPAGNGGKLGYVDNRNTFAISPRFLYADSFHEGMARVIIEGPCVHSPYEAPCPSFSVLPPSGGDIKRLPACKYAFIEKSGAVVSNERYNLAWPFSDGLAAVLVGKVWGYIDATGAMVIPPQFDWAYSFSEGFAAVQIGKLHGYIDKTGAMVISPRFQQADAFSEGLAVVRERNYSGYIDYQGDYVIEPQFSPATSFSEGLAVVYGDREAWYIDKSGHQAFPGVFIDATSFFKGLAHVQLDCKRDDCDKGTFAYIDRTGKVIFTYKR